MKIVQLTPGAGGMFCGSCMRDNALVAALRKLGHDAIMLPLYTPLTTDEPDNSTGRVFLGGINVYLQQKSAIFRHTPEWLDRRFDNPELLRAAARAAVKTKPAELGDLTLSVLRGEDGRQAKELRKLTAWLAENTKPDVVCLSNVLLSGLARSIRETLRVPVVCTLQGEDFFVDGLPAPQREQAWELLRQRAREIDAFIAVSRYYGEAMRTRLDVREWKVHVVHNGIDLSGYAPVAQKPAQPTIGYLARLAPEKGLHTLFEAFRLIHRGGKTPGVKLRVAGSFTAGDQPFVDALRADIERAELTRDVELMPNLDRAQKIAFLQSLSVFSVPATYGESFGLYVLEAMACGVPVVQPRHGPFPELIEATGGGVLCAPDDPADLAAKLEELLADDARRTALGEAGRAKVLAHFTVERMAREVAGVLERARA
jgi:glycosyltransferase involved in cell wall biosynthesis